MDASHQTDEGHIATAKARAVSNDLVKQIRKLRWIGMDSEAEVLQITLRHLQAADIVLGTPLETD